MMQAVESAVLDTGETTIHIERLGSGPAVLLLHGFPQTLAMWRDIAPSLATRFSVVCADLRGYGSSGCPPSDVDHAPYSKRAMARDMVAVMTAFGLERFSIAGHDRGGRVAYRLALDFPERVERLAVLDIIPVDSAWHLADERFALGFWPWSLLAQPEPLPERLLGSAPEAVIDHALSPEWGTPTEAFSAEARAQYID
jgi:haloacetate dehalogenase